MKYFFIFLLIFLLKDKYFFLLFMNIFLILFMLTGSMSYMMSMNDLFSYNLIILSFWLIIMMLMLVLNSSLYNFNNYMLKMILIILMMCLILSFSSKNFFIFYMFFELSVIPTFFLIMGWGYSIERLQASMYLMMYTIFFSFPFLYFSFKLKYDVFSLDMNYAKYFYMMKKNLMWSLWCILVFLVKLPMFLIHLWLPKAHLEAPLIGSMILAGILLKLGGYGILRIMHFEWLMMNMFSMYLVSISILGGLMVSLNCIRQIDLKMLIAYSSVSHMGMVLASILSYLKIGLMGSFFMMLSHGLSSSGLFMGMGLIYARFSSRSMMILKGSFLMMPMFFLFWFLLCSLNLSFPPSLNFFSEIFMMFAILKMSKLIFLFLIFMMFMTGIYSIYLYIVVGHSKNSMKECFMELSSMDFLLFFMHCYPLFMMIFIY